LTALFRVGAMDSHQQFRRDKGADVDLLRSLFPARRLRAASPFRPRCVPN
jgi:hypothetical protein